MDLEFRAEASDTGDGASLLQAMALEMRDMYAGLDIDGADMPKAGPRELSPPGGTFLVGYLEGRAVCCGGIKRLPDGGCEIKRMYVAPAARRQGVARAMLVTLEGVARRMGYTVVRLDTGTEQRSARRMYEQAGYREIDNFNQNPVATYFGEKAL